MLTTSSGNSNIGLIPFTGGIRAQYSQPTMANQAAPAPLTPVPALDGAGLDSGRKALNERLPRPWLFPLAVFAATWVMIVASWNIANLIYRTHWTWSKYFWIWDSGFYGSI